jgi:hypothetical protein
LSGLPHSFLDDIGEEPYAAVLIFAGECAPLCGAVLRADAVLAKKMTKALDLVAQGGKVRVRGR